MTVRKLSLGAVHHILMMPGCRPAGQSLQDLVPSPTLLLGNVKLLWSTLDGWPSASISETWPTTAVTAIALAPNRECLKFAWVNQPAIQLEQHEVPTFEDNDIIPGAFLTSVSVHPSACHAAPVIFANLCGGWLPR